jgi:hypothetical protein
MKLVIISVAEECDVEHLYRIIKENLKRCSHQIVFAPILLVARLWGARGQCKNFHRPLTRHTI